MEYIVEKILKDLSHSVPIFEYRVTNETGNVLAVVYNEELALKIKELNE